MPDVRDASQAGVGAPRPGGNPTAASGSAAPAPASKPAGSPTSPSSDDATVAAKKQAEHWRGKYERDIAEAQSLKEENARLKGLAEGLQAGKAPERQKNAASWEEADDATLSEAISKGVAEQNSTLIDMAIKERDRRTEQRLRTELLAETEKRTKHAIDETVRQQRMLNSIVNTFGADVLNEDSPIRQRADELLHERVRIYGEDAVRKMPDTTFDCFARAAFEIQAKRAPEYAEAQRKADAYEAQQEIQRSSVVGASKRRSEVSDKMKQGDRRGALHALGIPWLRKPG